MVVTLARHAEPDWGLIEGPQWRGAANDFAPLTADGRRQAADLADRLRPVPPSLVVSSPMTRALQTAAIVAVALSLELLVELRMHEWLPDTGFGWESDKEVIALYEDMIACDGVPPTDRPVRWESMASVRARGLAGVAAHVEAGRELLVVTHEVMIHALTGESRTGLAQVRVM